MIRSHFYWIVALAGMLIVSACENLPFGQPVALACPEILIPVNTDRVTRFAEGQNRGRDITDVVLNAEVKFFSGDCSFEENRIIMEFPIAVRGERGPAEDDGIERVDVFLAVTTRDRKILSRRQLPMRLPFEDNRTQIVSSDRITVDIPRDFVQTSQDFTVFIGLVLSKDELAFNRAEQRAR